MTRHLQTLIVLAAALGATGAAAQPLDLRLRDPGQPLVAAPLGGAGAPTPRPAPDLANPLDPIAPTTVQAASLQDAVFAKTAIDHRFTQQGVTGSVGFLCGLQPGHKEGGAAAYGVDPHGRFVGAKFSLAFN